MRLTEMFPDEASAMKWFERVMWKNGRKCGHCGSTHTVPANHKTMPYWCNDCRHYFSVRTGTNIEKSRVPYRKWVFAIYLFVTNLKGVSSMKLHRDIEVTQKTAWYMLHRLRDSWGEAGLDKFLGPVEVDESYFGGKRSNMSNSKRKALVDTGRGTVGKTAVAGIKNRETNEVRARVVQATDTATLHPFIAENVDEDATVYTDDASVYDSLPYNHEAVKHSVSEYVRDMAHTNGVESFWATMKRGHKGVYHSMSPKHLQRYVNEFSSRHNIRCDDTEDQMVSLAAMTTGKRLMYRDLISEQKPACQQ